MSAPPDSTPDKAITIGALEGALLSVAATEGAYLVEAAAQQQALNPMLGLGLALVAFAGYLGYKAYRSG